MQSDDPSDLPVTNHSIEYRADISSKLLAVADWKLVSNVTAEDVCLIKETWSPVSSAVVGVLPAGLTA